METKGDITIVEGIEVRRVKPGVYVREDEWQGYLEFNKPLSLSYMRKHEPFDELPLAYFPYPELDHSPPTLVFGFPISRDSNDFRRIALEKNLAPPEDCKDPYKSLEIRDSVMEHLNEICALKPGNHIADTGVFSLRTSTVLGLKTNYRQLVPEDKMDEVIQILKKHFPGTEPQWYLEAEIDLKPIHTLPMSMFEWSQPPGVSIAYSHVIAFNEVAPFRT